MENLFSCQYNPSDGRLGHRIPNPGIGLQYTFVRNSFLTLCQPEDHWSYWSCMEMVPWISGKQSLLDGIKPGVYFSEIKLQMKLEWFCFVLLWYHQEPFETKQTARFQKGLKIVLIEQTIPQSPVILQEPLITVTVVYVYRSAIFISEKYCSVFTSQSCERTLVFAPPAGGSWVRRVQFRCGDRNVLVSLRFALWLSDIEPHTSAQILFLYSVCSRVNSEVF